MVVFEVEIKAGQRGGLTSERGMVLAEGASIRDVIDSTKRWIQDNRVFKTLLRNENVILENAACVYRCVFEKYDHEDLSTRDLEILRSELMFEF